MHGNRLGAAGARLVVDQRHRGERHQRVGALVLAEDRIIYEIERNAIWPEECEEGEQRLGRWAQNAGTDRKAERRSDALRIGSSPGRLGDQILQPLAIAIERHSGQAQIGSSVIEGERQVLERRRQSHRALAIAAPRARQQKLGRRLRLQQVHFDLGCPTQPVRPSRGDHEPGAAARNEIGDQVGALDIVVDQQPRRGGSADLVKGGERRNLDVVFARELRVELGCERRQAGGQHCPVLRRRPPHARVVDAMPMGIFGDDRCLADAAHAVQGDPGSRRPGCRCPSGSRAVGRASRRDR